MIKDENLIRWVEQITTNKLPFRIWEDWIFNPKVRDQIKRQLPPGFKTSDYPFVYVSLNRPLSFLMTGYNPKDFLIADFPNANKSYLASKEMIDLGDMYRFELTPIGKTKAKVVVVALDLDSKSMFAFGKYSQGSQLEIGLVSKEPSKSGNWRVTYFLEDVGPTGHAEVIDRTEAVENLLENGYSNFIDPAVLDDILPTFTSL